MTSIEEDKVKQFGITTSMQPVYHYQQYTYKKLSDAVNYAEIASKRNNKLCQQSISPIADTSRLP